MSNHYLTLYSSEAKYPIILSYNGFSAGFVEDGAQ